MTNSVDPAGPPVEPGLKLRLKSRLGLIDELRLVPYLGHGTQRSLQLKGRLLEAKATGGKVAENGGVVGNVLTTLRRLESDEIPGAKLAATFDGETYELYTDGEGFFQLNLYLERDLDAGWHEVDLELRDSIEPDANARATAEVLVPSPDAEFAVVSDIDDTVIESSASDKLEQARLTLLNDAASRSPVDGIAELYQGLVEGPDGRGINPIFYLSRSGWNLYDLFVEFFEDNDIPRGPIFLRDLAVKEDKSLAVGSTHHKLKRIRELVQLYRDLPFVLIGDTGQGDPSRYRQIVIENPGRVRAVYLRQVDDGCEEVAAIAEDLRRRGVATLVAGTTDAFAAHMRAEGLLATT